MGMDTYEFLVELNNYLGFRFINSNIVAGDFGGLYYEISVVPDVFLKVHSEIRLFGDDPFKDHIKAAFEKLKFFKTYSLVNANLDLVIEPVTLSEDTAFSIMEDLTSFSETLTALGYKSVSSGDKGAAKEETDSVPGQVAANPNVSDKEDKPALPANMLRGIAGALIGTAGATFVWFLLAMTNYMSPFVIGAVLVAAVPVIMYELFSQERTSAFQIGICMFFSLLGIFIGERLIWTYTLIMWYRDITFEQAYYEIPHIVEDGIVEKFDYYKDYLVCFAALAIMYFVIIRNYLTGGKTINELLTSRKKR